MRDEIIEQIRKRGIGFPLTDGMRSLVATKSGNDSLLRRTLEEAERRRVNPTASTLPSENEGNELLERTRNVTLAAANAMPDFIVKQLIRRSVAYGTTANWIPQDNLTVAVGYRANVGEEYKVLTCEWDARRSRGAGDAAITASTRRKARRRAALNTFPRSRIFSSLNRKPNFGWSIPTLSRLEELLFTNTWLRRDFSTLNLSLADTGARAVVGSRGRLWIDRELDRVVRFEQIATEIPPDFPITAASSLIDYDWVQINERKYLLPTHSEILLTTVNPKFVLQSRNDVRFRGYQKYGAELKVVDEVGEDDEPPPPPKPIKPPQ